MRFDLALEPLEPASTREVGSVLAAAFGDSVDEWTELVKRETVAGRVSCSLSRLASSGTQVVGACLANPPIEGVARVGATGVAPGWRRRGVGRRLVGAVLAGLDRAGATRVSLEVSEDNVAAQGLYRELGFRDLRRLRVLTARRSSLRPAPGSVTATRISVQEALSALPSLQPSRPAFQRTATYVGTFVDGVVAHGVSDTSGLVGVVLQRGRDLLAVAAQPPDRDCIQALAWVASELSWVQRLIHAAEDDPVGGVLEELGFEVESRALEMVRMVP